MKTSLLSVGFSSLYNGPRSAGKYYKRYTDEGGDNAENHYPMAP